MLFSRKKNTKTRDERLSKIDSSGFAGDARQGESGKRDVSWQDSPKSKGRSKTSQAKYIVDVHSHILPEIDDGSRGIAETLKMLRTAQDEGITHIVATPHYKDGYHNASPQKVAALIEEVTRAAANCGIHIKLYQGNEILYCDKSIEDLVAGKVSTYNDSGRVLVEFMPTDEFSHIRNSLDYVMSEGYIPVLAHVERYACMFKDKSYAEQLKAMGVEIQANASSVIGDFGKEPKKFLERLLKNQVIDYIGTDAHHCEGRRQPFIRDCTEFLYKKYDHDYVDSILYKNALEYIC